MSNFDSPVELHSALKPIWSAETSANADSWSVNNVSRGQCAVTALIVQDEFGGELMRCTVDGESHYYNRLPSGMMVDLTADQFPADSIRTAGEVRDRAYVTSFQPTVDRYELLKAKLGI